MKITTRLKLNTVLAVGAILLMLISTAWSIREIHQAEQKMWLTNDMRKGAFERIVLRDEYLLHREERAAVQWQAKSETLRGLLETAAERFKDQKDAALLQEVRENFDATFSVLSAVLEKHQRQERLAGRNLAFDEAESRLISQVFLRANNLMDSIGRLYASTEMKATTTRNRAFLLIVFFVAGGGAAIIVNSFMTGRVITRRLAALHDGVAVIGSGNLDHRIDVSGDDELADLASESNQMAASLKESHTSIENLQQEITTRKQAEETLRVSEENFRRSLDDSPLGARIVSAEGETLYANRALLDIYGYESIEEFRSVPTKERYTADSYAEFLLRREKRQRGDFVPLDYEVGVIRKDGEVRNLRTFRKEILWDGARQYQVLYSDITDRKRAEEEIRRATQSMGALSDDLLKLSRVTRIDLHKESIDLSTMVREIAREYQKNNPGRVVEMIIPEGIAVKGDPFLIKIAMGNLLDNAFKFTGTREQARIEFGAIAKDGVPVKSRFSATPAGADEGEGGGRRSEGETVYFIRDNGVGFDMAYADKLFGAFQRLHNTEEFPGTGIGLATVRRIIHRHGGLIWAEGEVGKGATFYFTPPFKWPGSRIGSTSTTAGETAHTGSPSAWAVPTMIRKIPAFSMNSWHRRMYGCMNTKEARAVPFQEKVRREDERRLKKSSCVVPLLAEDSVDFQRFRAVVRFIRAHLFHIQG